MSLAPPEGVALPELLRALAARGVACAIPDGCLRISPHWPNSLDEVEVVAEIATEAGCSRVDA